MSELHRAGQPRREHLDGNDAVESKQAEVGEMVSVQTVTAKLSKNQPESTKTRLSCAGPAQIRDEDLLSISHQHMGDAAIALHHHPDSTSKLSRDLTEPASELSRDPLLGSETSPVEGLQSLDL